MRVYAIAARPNCSTTRGLKITKIVFVAVRFRGNCRFSRSYKNVELTYTRPVCQRVRVFFFFGGGYKFEVHPPHFRRRHRRSSSGEMEQQPVTGADENYGRDAARYSDDNCARHLSADTRPGKRTARAHRRSRLRAEHERRKPPADYFT